MRHWSMQVNFEMLPSREIGLRQACFEELIHIHISACRIVRFELCRGYERLAPRLLDGRALYRSRLTVGAGALMRRKHLRRMQIRPGLSWQRRTLATSNDGGGPRRAGGLSLALLGLGLSEQ